MAENGTNGISITGVDEYYQATSTNAAPSTTLNEGSLPSAWKLNDPTRAGTFNKTNKYLWNTERIKYSDSTVGNPTSPSLVSIWTVDGEPGRGISSITDYYLVSDQSTGITIERSDWGTTPGVTTPEQPYLWNYEEITWTSRPLTTHTDPAIIGVHGNGAEVYSLNVSDSAIIRDTNNGNILIPNYITLSATKQVGGNTPTTYSGDYRVYEFYYDDEGLNLIADRINPSSDGKYYIDSISTEDTPILYVKANLRVSNVVVDSQTIPVIDTGENGADATPVYNAWLSNENHTFSGDKDGIPIKINNVNQSTTSTIYIYKGSTRLTTFTSVMIPSTQGLTITRDQQDSTILIITASGTTAQTKPTESGTVNISVVADGKTFSLPFSYSISKVGATGEQGPQGLHGINTATVELFKTSDNKPTDKPANGAIYYFEDDSEHSAGELSGNLNNWQQSMPSAVPIWKITAVALSNSSTDTIDSSD